MAKNEETKKNLVVDTGIASENELKSTTTETENSSEKTTLSEMPEMSEEEKAQMDEAMARYRQKMKEQQAAAHHHRLIRTRKVMKGRKNGRKKRL
jgi:hypothetical protein